MRELSISLFFLAALFARGSFEPPPPRPTQQSRPLLDGLDGRGPLDRRRGEEDETLATLSIWLRQDLASERGHGYPALALKETSTKNSIHTGPRGGTRWVAWFLRAMLLAKCTKTCVAPRPPWSCHGSTVDVAAAA